MADNMQLRPPGGSAGYSAVAVQPGPEGPRRALLAAVLLIVAGALLGLIGGLIWGAIAPRVVYQVYTLKPPTAYAVNPETNAFIAADGIYSFIAAGGGILLGLAGYLFGVRRYGPLPMIGVVAGAVAAAFLAAWIGNVQTGAGSFDNTLSTSKPGTFLRAPIQLGSHGALAFWPVAAALVAGGLELMSFMRARQQGQIPAGAFMSSFGRHRLGSSRSANSAEVFGGADPSGPSGPAGPSGTAGPAGSPGPFGAPPAPQWPGSQASGDVQSPSQWPGGQAGPPPGRFGDTPPGAGRPGE
jgi:hypothetical protein